MMQVPQLQFAQMPIIQPRSEMQGFSDALLRAGAMRQERQLAERDRAEKLAAQKFQQDLQLKQFGLQERADTRAGEQMGMMQERHAVDMATATAAAQARQREENFKADFSARAEEFKGMDDIQRIGAVRELMMQHGTLDAKDEITLSQAARQAYKDQFDAELNPLRKKALEVQIKSQEADILFKQAQIKAVEAKGADGAKGPDLETAFDNLNKIYNDLQQNLDKTRGYYIDLQTVKKKLQSSGDLKSALDSLSPEQAKLQVVADMRQILAGNPTKEQLNQAAAQLSRVIDGEMKQLEPVMTQQDLAAKDAWDKRNAVNQLQTGIELKPYVPLTQGGAAPEPTLTAPVAPPVNEDMKKLKAENAYMKRVWQERSEGKSPGGYLGLGAFDKALEGASKLPTISQPPAPSGRFSERTAPYIRTFER